ncbi:hypothetical protein J7T55_003798 [Diaporthe amygdali]|uniref:uncharacterized protein n=1 Tax=Phomopsis amygdali TaxID=1214568 RepID=UPI0022FE2918|nr:uncharacterized protein J7T55_003798 [Diaporthe amygdali]KAJ0117384.1 hypothetical protein J7T55_003798 [Diaporthe amygdali]
MKAAKAIRKGSFSLSSNYKTEEFVNTPKLVERSASVKQEKKHPFSYLRIDETSSKKPATTKEALAIIENTIGVCENLPRCRLTKRVNLNTKASSMPGMTKREG